MMAECTPLVARERSLRGAADASLRDSLQCDQCTDAETAQVRSFSTVWCVAVGCALFVKPTAVMRLCGCGLRLS